MTADMFRNAVLTAEADALARRGVCPACKRQSLKMKHEGAGLLFHHCDGCGCIVVLNPRPAGTELYEHPASAEPQPQALQWDVAIPYEVAIWLSANPPKNIQPLQPIFDAIAPSAEPLGGVNPEWSRERVEAAAYSLGMRYAAEPQRPNQQVRQAVIDILIRAGETPEDAARMAAVAQPAAEPLSDALDARRYRWLRDKGELWNFCARMGFICAEVDAAIDAAIAAHEAKR